MNISRRAGLRIICVLSILMLSGLIAGEFVWGIWSNRRHAGVRTITLDSDLGLADSQLLEILDLEGVRWSRVDADELEARLESYPVVRKARVLKVFPDSLKVFLYRRKPLVIMLFAGDSESQSAVFDEEGYTVKSGEISGTEDLPIISGLIFERPKLGDRFPETVQRVLFDLSRLRKDDPELFSLLSEVEILPLESGGYYLKLFMNHIRIPVLAGRNLTSESLNKTVLVLDVLSSGTVGQKIEEVDIRGGSVVFRNAGEI